VAAAAVVLCALAGCAPSPSSGAVTVGVYDTDTANSAKFVIAPAHQKTIRVTLGANAFETFSVPMHVKTRITIVDGCSTDWTPTEDEPRMRVTFRNPRFAGDPPHCSISDGKSSVPAD
jgi:hypothetical protein